ncbi:MAG: glycosyltransferase family 4 protein [Caldisericia bacterium]|nr:glycosyltransferase family 4 protein [Caldisericia bacterium]
MAEIYSSCDVLLKMSRIEGFFGPPLEAMACECIPIISKVTGYNEYIIDQKNALVVEMGDIKGAEKAIQRLIDKPDLREELVENGKKTVKEWSWKRSIDYLEKVIRHENIEKVYESRNLPTYSYENEYQKIMNS